MASIICLVDDIIILKKSGFSLLALRSKDLISSIIQCARFGKGQDREINLGKRNKCFGLKIAGAGSELNVSRKVLMIDLPEALTKLSGIDSVRSVTE